MSQSPWHTQTFPAKRTTLAVLLNMLVLMTTLTASASASDSEGDAVDFDELAKQATALTQHLNSTSPPLPKVPTELASGAWSALRLPGGQGYVQPYPLCHKGKECTLGVAWLVKQGSSYRVKVKLELPPLPSGVEFENVPLLALLAHDREGPWQLLARYEGVRSGAGAQTQTTQWLAIVNLPAMTIALVHELETWGNSRTDPACGFDVYRIDLDGDGQQDLRFVRACRCPKKIPNCQHDPELTEEYLATKDHQFVLRPAALPPHQPPG